VTFVKHTQVDGLATKVCKILKEMLQDTEISNLIKDRDLAQESKKRKFFLLS